MNQAKTERVMLNAVKHPMHSPPVPSLRSGWHVALRMTRCAQDDTLLLVSYTTETQAERVMLNAVKHLEYTLFSSSFASLRMTQCGKMTWCSKLLLIHSRPPILISDVPNRQIAFLYLHRVVQKSPLWVKSSDEFFFLGACPAFNFFFSCDG